MGMISALLHRYSVSQLLEDAAGAESSTSSLSQSTAEPAEPTSVASLTQLKRFDSNPQNLHRRILVCTPSNTAVDELLSRLLGGVWDASGTLRAVKMVRLGPPLDTAAREIHELGLEYQTEKIVRGHNLWAQYTAACDSVEELYRKIDAAEESKRVKARSTAAPIINGQ